MRETTLTPEGFRKLLRKTGGTEEIGRLLTAALDDFRDNKIDPHLYNLQKILAATVCTFDSIQIYDYKELIGGVKLDNSDTGPMLELICELQHSNEFRSVQEKASWACGCMAKVVREGLAVRRLAEHNSELLILKKCLKREQGTGLLFVEEYKFERSYAYEYELVHTRNNFPIVKLIELKRRNFPLIANKFKKERGRVGRSVPSGVGKILPKTPSEHQQDKFWWKLDKSVKSKGPVFYLLCRLSLPFNETVLPLAREQLKSRLQESHQSAA